MPPAFCFPVDRAPSVCLQTSQGAKLADAPGLGLRNHRLHSLAHRFITTVFPRRDGDFRAGEGPNYRPSFSSQRIPWNLTRGMKSDKTQKNSHFAQVSPSKHSPARHDKQLFVKDGRAEMNDSGVEVDVHEIMSGLRRRVPDRKAIEPALSVAVDEPGRIAGDDLYLAARSRQFTREFFEEGLGAPI